MTQAMHAGHASGFRRACRRHRRRVGARSTACIRQRIRCRHPHCDPWRSCGDRARLARLREDRRLHRVPELRLGLGLAAPHRQLDRRASRSIVTGRDNAGALLFICCRSAIEARGFVRRLTWLGSELCDYNGAAARAGFLAADRCGAFPATVARDRCAAAKPSAYCASTSSTSTRCRRRSARRPIRSSALGVGTASERRLSDAVWAATGRASTPRSVRRRRAAATAPSARSSREFGEVSVRQSAQGCGSSRPRSKR